MRTCHQAPRSSEPATRRRSERWSHLTEAAARAGVLAVVLAALVAACAPPTSQSTLATGSDRAPRLTRITAGFARSYPR